MAIITFILFLWAIHSFTKEYGDRKQAQINEQQRYESMSRMWRE